MHPRQYARMQKKNALKRGEKRNPAQPEVEVVVDAPLDVPSEPQDDYKALLDRMWKDFHALNGAHWLWRAGQLMEYVEKHGYRHDAPKTAKGKRIPIRKQIGLPPDPKRVAFQDDVIAAVEVKVKSLPNKGNVPIFKPVGFRELEDKHTRANAYVRDPNNSAALMHVTMRDPIHPRDLITWLAKILRLIQLDGPETSVLKRRIVALEFLYAPPRDIVQRFDHGPSIRLASAGASESSSKPKTGLGRVGMTKDARRSRLYHYKAQIAADNEKENPRSQYMSQRMIAKAFQYELVNARNVRD